MAELPVNHAAENLATAIARLPASAAYMDFLEPEWLAMSLCGIGFRRPPRIAIGTKWRPCCSMAGAAQGAPHGSARRRADEGWPIGPAFPDRPASEVVPGARDPRCRPLRAGAAAALEDA